VAVPDELAFNEESAGTYFLLVDRQENVDRRAYYYHDIRKITSENGVQSGASISVSFNPAFEKLTFHAVRLIRSNVSSDRLNRSQIKLIPTKEDSQELVYDPHYTAQTVLDDVRVGDLIERAYSIEGENPMRKGKYFALFPMQWGVPIGRNVLRLIYSSHRRLAFRERNDSIQPVVSTEKGITQLSYESTNVPGLKVGDDVPDDYVPARQLHVSEFGDWAEVAQWALPLFEAAIPNSREFNDQITKLNAIADPEQRIVEALRFVEDEIRYIAVESDAAAHPPTSLDDVVQRRFADDKDKAMLLVTLLRRSDIDAAPALASKTFLGGLRDLIPSARVLDHAIVQVRLGATTHWLDPARPGQRGPLSQIYIADYGEALVLRPNTNGLTAFAAPRPSWPVKKVVENYRIQAPGRNSELDVVSEYRGVAADRTRNWFRENTREEIQKRYLDYYARNYPEIKVQKRLFYEELSGENSCRVTESYVIPKMWQLSEDNERYRIFLKPGDIYSALGSTTAAQRDEPLKLDYPNTVVQEMNIQMFEDWPLEVKPSTISTEFFRVRDEPTSHGSSLQLNYSFEALNDRVEVSGLPKFNKAIDDAKDSLGYKLTYRTPAQMKKTERNTLNWAVAAAALCFFGTASFLAYRYFRDSRLVQPLPPPIDAPAGLNGLGGWLIILAIGQTLRPFGFIKTGFDLYPTIFNTNSWRLLTDPIESSYHPWWAPSLLFELFFNIASFVFCVLLIALFFRKRAVWPLCFVFFLIAYLFGSLLDIYFVHHIPAVHSLSSSIADLIAIVLGAAIWIPYLYRSKRVKSTFRY
jgi:transglutaminase-like putative cysteine protease